MSRELVVLGTAGQVPTRDRHLNGYLLRWDQEALLFDPGEGTQRQMILAGVRSSSITRILISHFHGDHCLGLPGVVQRMALDRAEHTVSIFYPAGGEVYLERLLRSSIQGRAISLDRCPVSGPGPVAPAPPFDLVAARLDHRAETLGWRLKEPDGRRMVPEKLAARGISGPAIGRLQREGWLQHQDGIVRLEDVSEVRRGQSFAFLMDTRLCDAAFQLAQGVDMLVCESTFLDSEADLAQAYGHLTAAQAARIALKAGARLLVLTHFSQRYPDVSVLAEEAAAMFPDVVAARDLATIPVPPRE